MRLIYTGLVLVGLVLTASTRAQQNVVRTADIALRGYTQTDFPRMHKLAENVYVYEELQAIGQIEKVFTTNCFIVVTSDGVLVADGLINDELVSKMLAAIAKITRQPVKYVVVGADHGDHTGGNAAFPKTATFIAHPTSAAVLARRANAPGRPANAPPFPVPTELVADKKILKMGDTEIQILFLGRAHTGGDLTVYLPGSHIMFMSEVYFNRLFPSTYSSYPLEWIAAIKKAEALEASIYVPGHGFIDSPKVLNEELVTFRTSLEMLEREGRRLHDAGVPLDQAPRQSVLGPFAYWTRAAQNLPDGLKRVYLEADGQLK